MSDHRPVIAAFDVDGTITTRDCVVPFMRRVSGARRVGLRLAARPHRVVPALARCDRDRIKELAAAAAFAGQETQRVNRIAEEFAADVHARWLRGDTIASLQQHRAAGHHTVLVSASFEVYLRPLARRLCIDDVLGTRLAVENGILTGTLAGPNCRGPEKVRRLHSWMMSRGLQRADAVVVAFGDSAGDRELLADADEAHWIGR